MLGIFNKELVQPPQELNSPIMNNSTHKAKFPQEILNDFVSSYSNKALSIGFGNSAALAYVPPQKPDSIHQRYVYAYINNKIEGGKKKENPSS